MAAEQSTPATYAPDADPAPEHAPAKRKRARDRDNLFFNEERGVFYWRMVHPLTKKRIIRNTEQERRDLARRTAARFEDELRAELAGVKTFEEFRGDLGPLVEEWCASLATADLPPQDATLKQKKRETLRALEQLRLRTAADLTHVARIDDRLRALARLGVKKITMRRCYQDQLKQFSRWLAENGRYLPDDPLRLWKPIRVPRDERRDPRQAFMPADVARAFAALDVLDKRHRRQAPARPFFTAMLVAAPRVEALVSRDVRHFDARGGRIDLGLSVGNKIRGAGAIDPATAAVTESASEGRGPDEPLFLSPDGARWTKERALDAWREAWSLGLVVDLWPADESPSVDVALLVSRALLKGRVAVSKGGNPRRVRKETLDARVELERRVARLVEHVRDDWTARMAGVVVHSFRATLQTWCEAQGVPAPVIDRQLGHDDPRSRGSMDVLKAIAGSRTGRRHYLDLNSKLFDPARAAVAVRELLDQAEAELRASGSMLVTPAEPEERQAREA